MRLPKLKNLSNNKNNPLRRKAKSQSVLHSKYKNHLPKSITPAV